MKKQLKLFLAVICTIMLSVALVACGGDNGGSGPDVAVNYDKTIVFWHSAGQNLQEKLNIAVANFEAKYPGWEVSSVQISGGYDGLRDKISSDLGVGSQPDVAFCYADHVAKYMQGNNPSKGVYKVADMAPLINSTATLSNGTKVGYTAAEQADFISGFYTEGYATNYADYETYGFNSDSILTLPFAKSTEVMYYNKTALDALGLQPAQTWDELWEQAGLIIAKWPNVTPLGYDSEANWFITMCEQNGWGYTTAAGADDEHYLFYNDGIKGWLEDIHAKFELAYIETQKTYGAYTSGLFTNGTDTKLDDGKLAAGCVYCIGSSAGASHQNPNGKFEWGIAPIPASNDSAKGNAAISQGPSLVMFYCDQLKDTTKEEKLQMTFQFVKELLDPAFQAEYSMTSGYMAVRNSTFDIPAYAEHLASSDITAVAAKIAADMRSRYFTSPAFIGSSQARDQVGAVVTQVLNGEKDADQALRDALANCGGRIK